MENMDNISGERKIKSERKKRVQMTCIEYEDGTIEMVKPERKKLEKRKPIEDNKRGQATMRKTMFKLLGIELPDDITDKEYNKLILKSRYQCANNYIRDYIPLKEAYDKLLKENEDLKKQLKDANLL